MKYSIAVLALLGKASASEIARHFELKHADSFDRDPDTSSMYDDQHVYSKPGQNWEMSPAEKAAAAKAEAILKAGAPEKMDVDESGAAPA